MFLQLIYQMHEQLMKHSPYEEEAHAGYEAESGVNADDGNFDNLLEGMLLAVGGLVAGLVPAPDEMVERVLGWAVGLTVGESLDGLLGRGFGLTGLPLAGLQFLIMGLPIRN